MSLRGTGPAPPDALRGVRVRAAILAVALGLGLVAVFGRAVHLQVVERERLGSLAHDQYVRTVELAARRGEIQDRSGGTLASSVEVDSIHVDPGARGAGGARRDRLDALARAAQLGKEKAKRFVARAEKPGSRFVWLKRRASPAVVAEVRKLGLPGVALVKEPRRFYPQRTLAAHVLGFAGADGKGLEGLERTLDEELRGRGASVDAVRDARGRALAAEELVPAEERTGATVTLTIDRSIQYLAEKALAKTIESTRAAAGTAVVMDPRTGEVLALASAPTFNPNVVPGREQRDAVRNRAVTDSFEPGSTMKVFLLAAALDAGAIRKDQSFDCEKGAWRVGRHVVHDTHAYTKLTPPEILKVSSNICSGKVGLAFGGAKVAEAYRAFGFGAKTGVGLPGEAKGVVGKMKGDIEVVTAAFGQGPVTASPLQLAAGLSAIANGGTLLEPWIVKKVVEPDGTVSREGGRKEVRRVVSERTARELTRWMEGVTDDGGTAEGAAIDGYPVAGKTGTAQKVSPAGGYGAGRIASFGGFVPADDPRLVVLVVIDEPKTEIYGGLVAGPAFREIAVGALKVLGVPPSRPLTAKKEAPAKPKPAKAEELAAEGFVTELDEGAPAPVPGGVVVADARGRHGRAAVRRIARASLEVRLEGSGKATGQAPPPGAVVPPGSRVQVRLSPL